MGDRSTVAFVATTVEEGCNKKPERDSGCSLNCPKEDLFLTR